MMINEHESRVRKKGGGRVVAFVLIGAVLGSLFGGGAVFYYLRSNQAAYNENVLAYIDAALEQAQNVQMDEGNEAGDVDTAVFAPEAYSPGYSEAVQSVAETVMPSVVGVRTTQDVLDFRRGTQEVEGIGTGVIVSSDGLILTNQHVISSNPKTITVTLMDGTEHNAQVLFASEEMDLAVIRIEATGLKAVKLGDSSSLRVGEVAIAIGNPLGLEYERSVTAGIVSALNRSILISQTQVAQNLIQTDAAINSGNSGGPLLSASGEVIGINTYKLRNVEGMGFAVPINAAKPVLEQILRTGEFKQVQLGVSLIDKVLLSYYENEEISIDKGVYVYSIDNASDAYEKGLRAGDVITHIDGAEVNTTLEFRSELYRHVPGDIVTLTVLRGETSLELTAVLGGA